MITYTILLVLVGMFSRPKPVVDFINDGRMAFQSKLTERNLFF